MIYIYVLNKVCITVSSTLWKKCLSITSLAAGRKVATLPPDLPVERLVISLGEILNACKSQIH